MVLEALGNSLRVLFTPGVNSLRSRLTNYPIAPVLSPRRGRGLHPPRCGSHSLHAPALSDPEGAGLPRIRLFVDFLEGRVPGLETVPVSSVSTL